jgi:16S rRNA (guanine527-N7)-methyltransferase
MKIEEFFLQQTQKLNINLTHHQVSQFKIYCDYLIEVSQLYNLTAIKDEEGIFIKHFLDSISLLEFLDLKDQRVLDIGTGAGFPGVPLKIAQPDVEIVLLDSNNKKIEFLQKLIEKLDLKSIYTVHSRVEEYLDSKRFDVVTSRAVAKLSTLFELSYPWAKKGGLIVAYKGRNLDLELRDSKHIFELYDISYEIHKASIESMDHQLILMKKNSDKELKQRPYSQILKTPLW